MKDGIPATTAELKANFNSIRSKQKAFTKEIDTVLRRIISARKIDVVNIESRTKSVDSFCAKALRDDKNYFEPLIDMTDLSGCRIICYYTSDIDDISKLIDENFLVDKVNSVDKLTSENPNQFGYQSKHLVISFSPNRLRLDDYKEFSGMKAEIQIRTSLQHSWAAIEHKLQYKNAQHIAPPLKRKLFRIAALLELADEEFNYLEKNIGNVRKEISQSIESGDLSYSINADSVDIFIISSGLIHEVKSYFEEIGFSIAPPPPSARQPIAKLIDTLISAEIGSVADLQGKLLKVSPRTEWKKFLSIFYKYWKDNVPHARPVVDSFTIVRIMVCFASNEKIFRRILRDVPFGPRIQDSLIQSKKEYTE